MRQEVETYELIEQYLNNQLSAQEYSDIEARIQSDPGFASLVEQQRNIHSFITNSSLLSIGAELEKIHKKYNAPSNGLSGWRWMLIVFPGILFIAGILFLKHGQNNLNQAPDKISLDTMHITPHSTRKVPNDTIIRGYDTIRSSIIHPQIQDQRSPALVPNVEPVKQQEENSEPAAFKSFLSPDKPVNHDTLPELSGLETTAGSDNQDSTLSTQEKPVQIDICEDIKIIGKVNCKASCLEKPTGQIIVLQESLQGGTPPYEISVGKDGAYSGQLTISGITPGYYQVYIQDKNKCISLLGEYLIESKECTYEYIFAPDKGEVWAIPDFEIPYTLKIFKKNGQIVFEERFDYEENFEWNGRTNTGEELPMGAYMFILESDNRETLYGTVTLIR